MRILTGSTGASHVTAADDGALYAGIVGSGSYVLDIGQKFAATVLSAVAVKLGDGDGILQGRHFRTEPGDSDTVAIAESTAGSNRNDIIGVKYVNNAGVESMAWQVIKGTATTGTATDPTYDEGDVLGGDTEAFMPMYRVRLSGASISTVEPLFAVLTPANSLANVARSGSYTDLTNKPITMTGATTSAAGKTGFVPAPAAGAATRYLRSDGTWQVPPDTKTTVDSAMSDSSANPVQNKIVKAYIDGIVGNVETLLAAL